MGIENFLRGEEALPLSEETLLEMRRLIGSDVREPAEWNQVADEVFGKYREKHPDFPDEGSEAGMFRSGVVGLLRARWRHPDIEQ